MPTKPSLRFTAAFVLITLLTILGDTLPLRWLHYVSKPLIMVLLLGFVWQQDWAKGYPNQIRWLLAGMVFALAGDVFLMIRERDLFVPGLGAFLMMQLGYSRAFYLSIRQHRARVSIRFAGLMGLLFLLCDAGFLYLLRPTFVNKPALTGLWWPVVLYAVCLSVMGLLATLRPRVSSYGWVMVGALLFIQSDSLIAVNKFLLPLPGSAFLVMSTYAAAQYLIVGGLVRQARLQPGPTR